MPTVRSKIIYPCGAVLALSLVVVALFPDPQNESRWNEIRQEITAAPPSGFYSSLQAAEKYIQFQRQALNPAPGTAEASRIAELYFQVGEAILSRPAGDYLPEARDQFVQAVNFYPPLRQGWLYYQLGRTVERIGPPHLNEAKSYYAFVSLYNPGRLTLLAGYRMMVIDRRIQPNPVEPPDPKPLYNYIRFYSRDMWNDLEPFAGVEFAGHAEGIYLAALQAYRNSGAAAAAREMDRYLTLRPADPSAEYFRDGFAGRSLRDMYPADGDLLRSCYAPRAHRDGFFYLPQNGALSSDVYVSAPEKHGLRITLRLAKPWTGAARISVWLNNDTRVAEFHPNERLDEQALEFGFDTLQERNLLQCLVFMEEEDEATVPPRLLRILSLKADRIPRETAR